MRQTMKILKHGNKFYDDEYKGNYVCDSCGCELYVDESEYDEWNGNCPECGNFIDYERLKDEYDEDCDNCECCSECAIDDLENEVHELVDKAVRKYGPSIGGMISVQLKFEYGYGD